MARGGNQSGKTTWGAMEAYWWLTGTHPYRKVPVPCSGCVVAADWSLIGEVIWEKLGQVGGLRATSDANYEAPILPSRLIKEISWMDKKKEIPDLVKLKNGSKLFFKSCDGKETKFMGTQYDFIWNDEEIANEMIVQEQMRALMARASNLWWTATPLARAMQLVELSERAKDPKSVLKVEEAILGLLDNPYISDSAKQAFIESISDEYKQTRIYGDFLTFEGLVYKHYSDKVHIVPQRVWDSTWPVTVVIDPGFANPCGILWIVTTPTSFVVYREILAKGASVQTAAKWIVDRSRDQPVMRVIIDRESLKKNMGYAVSIFQQFNNAFEKLGFKHPITKHPMTCTLSIAHDLLGGIGIVGDFLTPMMGAEPKLLFTNNLVELPKEFRRYMWPKSAERGNAQEKPVDKYNHLLGCLRYFCCAPLYFAPVKLETDWSAVIAKRIAERHKKKHSNHVIGG